MRAINAKIGTMLKGVLCGLMMVGVGWGQTSLATNAPADKPLSTRVVDYAIDAKVDMKLKSLDATETLTYKNLTGQPLSEFPFHLYLNAFQPESTFTTEEHYQGGVRGDRSSDYPAKKLGSVSIASIDADGMGNLSTEIRFIAPDDGNVNDRTVMMVALPHPVAAGESITFHLRFHDQFPESIARNGYKRDFLMGGQWFPKVGVFWHGKWNCHQYHSTTEFFSDFGTFHVKLTVPKEYVIGASGVPTGEQTNADGTKTLGFYGEDIGDFAWAASPHFQVTTDTFLSSMGPVQIRVLALAAHPKAGPRYMKIMQQSLAQFDQRYGPYPYKILTVIDPEPDSEIYGMEYPTLFTGGTEVWDPTYETEVTAEHEFGHQYWYGMVATNEFEDAWLDEGINSYTEATVMAAIEGKDASVLHYPFASLSDAGAHYASYVSDPDYDPVVRHAWQFVNEASYGAVTYSKSATLLKTLEGIIGRDTMDEAMHVYFMRYRFTHPTTEDFLRTIEEVAIRKGRATGVAGKPDGTGPSQTATALGGLLNAPELPNLYVSSSLRPFFDQAVFGTSIWDYAVENVNSAPLQWWKKDQKKPIRSEVTVHRIGDFVMPVTLEVRFSDGSRVRELWVPPATGGAESNNRWKTYTYVKDAEIVSAEIDPDHTVMLDVDHFNDSYVEKRNGVASSKVTNLWVSALGVMEQMAGWLV